MVNAVLIILAMFGSLVVAGLWLMFFSRRRMKAIESLVYQNFPVISRYTRKGKRWIATYLVVETRSGPKEVLVPVWEKAGPGRLVRLAVHDNGLTYESTAKYKHFFGLGAAVALFGIIAMGLVVFAVKDRLF